MGVRLSYLGVCMPYFCEIPTRAKGIFYAIRDVILWHILRSYLLQTWGLGVAILVFSIADPMLRYLCDIPLDCDGSPDDVGSANVISRILYADSSSQLPHSISLKGSNEPS